MEEKNFLALGSVVELKKLSDLVLIIGANQTAEGQTYDYCGCIHPYGYVDSEKLILFNNNEIEKVIFEGYYDEESKDFFEDIEWLRNKKKEEGK